VQQIDTRVAIAKPVGQPADERGQQPVDLVLARQHGRERVERGDAVERAAGLRAVTPERFEPFGGDSHRTHADRETGGIQEQRLKGIVRLPSGQRQRNVRGNDNGKGEDGGTARIGNCCEPEPEEEVGEGALAVTDHPQHHDAADPEEEDRQARQRRVALPGDAPEGDQPGRAERDECPADYR
jgi:hypothetical protein